MAQIIKFPKPKASNLIDIEVMYKSNEILIVYRNLIIKRLPKSTRINQMDNQIKIAISDFNKRFQFNE